MSGPRLTERRIDVGTTTNVGESDPNGRERGSNGPRRRVVLVFVPVIRTAFLVRWSFCIVREREEELERPPNEVGTEGAGGQKWDDFPLRKHSFQSRFQIVPNLRFPLDCLNDRERQERVEWRWKECKWLRYGCDCSTCRLLDRNVSDGIWMRTNDSGGACAPYNVRVSSKGIWNSKSPR